MKKTRIFPLLLALCLLFAAFSPCALALDDPELNAEAAILVDLDSGRVLYDLNSTEARAPASLTKIMTVLLALDAVDSGRADLETMITAQDDCRYGMDESSSTAGIQPGMTLSLRELLYCAMLKSANEACNIIGAYLSGSVSAFVGEMNQRAASLGCVNTQFMNPNGLSESGHYTCAYDLYLITAAAMQHPFFIELCNTKSYQSASPDVNGGEPMYNSNALISSQSDYGSTYLYEYASGVKTGYTRAAGYCLVSTALKDGVHVLSVVLGCDGWLNAQIEEYKNFSDTITLFDWGFDNFSYRQVLDTGDAITKMDVELAQGDGQVTLYPQNDVELLLPNDMDLSELERSVIVYSDRLVAPIDQGTVLGEATLYLDKNAVATVRLVNGNAVELARGEYMKERVAEFLGRPWVIAVIVILVIFAIAYIVLVTRYRRLRRKHLKERKLAEKRREEQKRVAQQDFFDGEWKDLY